MFDMSATTLIGGFVFGSIGFVAFVYGKRMHLWKIMLVGLAMMIFPYFIENMLIQCAIGAVATVALFFLGE
ncbi:MAG: amino acid transport protein [Verrucomicrobiota bacterium]